MTVTVGINDLTLLGGVGAVQMNQTTIVPSLAWAAGAVTAVVVWVVLRSVARWRRSDVDYSRRRHPGLGERIEDLFVGVGAVAGVWLAFTWDSWPSAFASWPSWLAGAFKILAGSFVGGTVGSITYGVATIPVHWIVGKKDGSGE